jgi:Cu(I)/Ag(I) efflux system periplasmic protein CusF
MKNSLIRVLSTVLLAFGFGIGASPVFSQAANDPTLGEVRKVDKEEKKVTIKHGEIKNLDMPPMTMVFQVKEAALLDNLKPGDKIRFRVVKEGRNYVVTEMTKSE